MSGPSPSGGYAGGSGGAGGGGAGAGNGSGGEASGGPGIAEGAAFGLVTGLVGIAVADEVSKSGGGRRAVIWIQALATCASMLATVVTSSPYGETWVFLLKMGIFYVVFALVFAALYRRGNATGADRADAGPPR